MVIGMIGSMDGVMVIGMKSELGMQSLILAGFSFVHFVLMFLEKK